MNITECLYKNISFRIIDIFRKTNALSIYDKMQKNGDISRKLLIKIQKERLRDIIIHCWNNVPYYRKLFKQFNIEAYR